MTTRPPNDRPRRAWLALCAALLAVLAAAWWLTTDEHDAASLVTDRAAREARDTLEATPPDDDATPAPATPTPDDAPTSLVAPPEPTIFGRVIDEDGEPLEGATVTAAQVWFDTDYGHRLLSDAVFERDILATWTTRSRADGTWSLVLPDDLGPGPARPTGREGVLLCHAAPGRQVGVEEWNGRPDVGDVALVGVGRLTGRVVDEHGEPLAGARVWAVSLEPYRRDVALVHNLVEGLVSTTTGDDGRFTTQGFMPVAAELIIEGRGVERVVRVEGVPFGEFDVGDIGVFVGGTVRGTVRDASGALVPDARVFVAPLHENGLDRFDDAVTLDLPLARHMQVLESHDHALVTTDADGAFAVHGLTRRDLWITVDHPRHGIAPRAVTLVDARAEVDVVLPPARDPLVIALRPHRDGTPRRLDDLDMWVTDSYAIEPRRDGTTSRGGLRAAVEALGPDRIAIRRLGSIGHELGISDGASVEWFVPADVSMDVFPPGELVGIRGRVVGATAAARVDCVHDDGTKRRIHELASDGSFAVDMLKPGTWHLTAVANGHRAGSTQVNVAPGGFADGVAIELGPTGTLVIDVPGARRPLTIEARHTITRATVRSGRERRFNDLLPGTWRVAGPRFAPIDVVISPGATTRVTMHPLDGPRIVGRVTHDGTPVASGRVVLAGTSADVGSDGTYELALPPSHVDGPLVWSDEAAYWVDDDVAVPPGATLVHDIEIGAGTSLEVSVIGPDDEPLADVPIRMHSSDLRISVPLGVTDATGHLRVSPFSGRARVSVGGDHAPAGEIVDATTPGRRRVELRTRSTGRLNVSRADRLARDDEDAFVYLAVRLESTATGELVHDVVWDGGTIDDAPIGTWRVVAVPAWLDVDAVPLGVGTLVEIRHGERTTVTVPLTY